MPKKSKDASSDVPPADLYWAARHGSELRIRAALDKGAAVDALFDGRPALVVAALSDQPHAVETCRGRAIGQLSETRPCSVRFREISGVIPSRTPQIRRRPPPPPPRA